MNAIIINIVILLFYVTAWFVTRRFYRKHKKEVLVAVENGDAKAIHIPEGSSWFQKCTLTLATMALVAVLIPTESKLLPAWLIVSLIVYFIGASASESMRRADIKHEEYEAWNE